MDTVEKVHIKMSAEPRIDEAVGVQFGAFLLELSLDWIVLRASENVHRLLGESHVTLIDQPLSRFVHSQALHDLRNLFSRLSGTTGIARAYAVRLTDEQELVDIAFQLSDGRVLLEAVASTGSFGECFGTVGGLIAGLSDSRGQGLLDSGARRMRALTGHDRVTVGYGERRAESSRGAFVAPADMARALPVLVADAEAGGTPVFPPRNDDTSVADALMRSCDARATEQLSAAGVRSALRVPFVANGVGGEFRCESRKPRQPSFELHAAAELFAQLFALRLEIDRLKR